MVFGDEIQLEQVFLNLFNNSLDAMPRGGTITIATVNSGKGVRVEFRDSGEGMTAAALSQIFRPFFTTKEIGKGTGLGLSIVEEILSAHGATIDVKSDLGRGTTFIFFFPATDLPVEEVHGDDTATRR
jgi:signal transduction histidine kinase